LLSLRLRNIQGPTLVSRLVGAAEDCRLRLEIVLDALLDMRRMIPPLVVGTGGVSEVNWLPVFRLWPSDVELVFLETIDSGNWNNGGHKSSSLAESCSGEACIEEEFVRVASSGVMMGDPCRELDATEEPLMAEMELGTEGRAARVVRI
jgi:hypothetical protein